MSSEKVEISSTNRGILSIIWNFLDKVKVADHLPTCDTVQISDDINLQSLTGYTEKLVYQLQNVVKLLKQNQSFPSSQNHTPNVSNDEKYQDNENRRTIDLNLVQVRADKSEIDRRIAAFIERKQQEVDENNKREFCSVFSIDKEPENSCARTDAVFMAGSESKCHVKVSRVVNSWGPQTHAHRDASPSEQPPNLGTELSSRSAGIHDRLKNMENHLGMRVRQDSAKNVSTPELFHRIKELEERILYLESLSPEYFNAIPAPKKMKKEAPPNPLPYNIQDGTSHIYRGLSMSEINERISSLQNSLRQRDGSDL